MRFSADARGYVCKLHVELYDLMCSRLSVRESFGMHLLKAVKRTGKEICIKKADFDTAILKHKDVNCFNHLKKHPDFFLFSVCRK